MLLESIEHRRSIRKYENSDIQDNIIIELIESARLAPSGSNSQPWHFVIVKDAKKKEEIVENANNQKWMLTAPVFIICVADVSGIIKDKKIEISEDSPEIEVKDIIRDTTIAAQNIVIQASHIGLGTCYVSWYKQKDIRPILNIPSDKFVVCILTVGYANEKPNQRPRKSKEQIIHYELW